MDNIMNLNAEIFRNLSYIADDENCMKKALQFIKKLAAQKASKEEYKPASKEEILIGVKQACKELKLHKEGKLEFKSAEELLDEL